jgi:hypothetical protein
METVYFYETLVSTYESMQSLNLECQSRQLQGLENVKSHITVQS